MNVMGLIFANDATLGALTDKRTMASLPYGGRYRQIDFPLSNMPAAGIRHISAGDVQNFKDHGYVCKLVSTGILEEGKLSAFVQPTLFAAGNNQYQHRQYHSF